MRSYASHLGLLDRQLARGRILKFSSALCIVFAILLGAACGPDSHDTVVIVSANAEWRALLAVLKPRPDALRTTPYGQYFVAPAGSIAGVSKPLLFFHGGWGKVDAAASAQWALSKWAPQMVVNLGTAGGFPGRVREGDIVFATSTIVYDIVERMGSAQEAIDDYTTDLEPVPESLRSLVIGSPMISADQDIDPQRIPELTSTFGAVAADWESASIARVCKKNNVRVIILRGVSDVVDVTGSRTYGNIQDFESQSRKIMGSLILLLAKVV